MGVHRERGRLAPMFFLPEFRPSPLCPYFSLFESPAEAGIISSAADCGWAVAAAVAPKSGNFPLFRFCQ